MKHTPAEETAAPKTYECGVDFCENCGCCFVCYPDCCESRDEGVCWVSDDAYAAARPVMDGYSEPTV